MPLFSDHLFAEGNVDNLEFRGFAPQRVSALGTPGDNQSPITATDMGLLRYLTANDGSNPRHYIYYRTRADDNVTPIWARISRPYKNGNGEFEDFAVPSGQFAVGSANGKLTSVAKSLIPLSGFGTPTADIDLGGTYRIKGLPLTPGGEPSEAASVQFVTDMAQGMQQKDPVKLRSTTGQPTGTWTYDGSAGTLTRTTFGAIAAADIDSGATGDAAYTLLQGDSVLIKTFTEPSAFLNGIYEVTVIGNPSTATVLTRRTDANTELKLRSATTFVLNGSGSGETWTMNAAAGSYALNPGSGVISFSMVQDATQYTGAANQITISGTVIKFYTGTWAQDSLFVAPSANTIGELTKTTYVTGTGSGRLLQQDTGGATKWSKFTFDHGDTGGSTYVNRLLFWSSNSAIGSLATATKGILATDGSGVPSILQASGNAKILGSNSSTGAVEFMTTLPFTLTLNNGGTNNASMASLGGVGSIIYKTSTNLTPGTAPAGSIAYEIPYWNGSALGYFDLFGGNNTWTGTNVFRSAVGLMAASPGVNSTFSDSPRLQVSGAGRNGSGTVTVNQWDLLVDVTDIAGAGTLKLLNDVAASPNPTNVISEWTTTGNYSIRGTAILFKAFSGAPGTLSWSPTATTTATIPDSAGTNFTLVGLELAQTWSGAQTFVGTSGNAGLTARVTGDHASAPRLTVDYNGKLSWGAGGASPLSPDVTLDRSTGSTLRVTGNLAVTGNLTGTWIGSTVGTAYGGTGANLNTSAYGLVYRTNASPAVFAVTAAGTAGQPILSGGTGAPSWASYKMPSTLTNDKALLRYNSSLTTLQELAPVSSRVLVAGDYTGVLNTARTTGDSEAGGIMRKFSSRKTGDGTSTITVTHSLGTYDVMVSARKSDSANDTDCKRAGTTGAPYNGLVPTWKVVSKDAVTFHFASNQTASDYWVFTIAG